MSSVKIKEKKAIPKITPRDNKKGLKNENFISMEGETENGQAETKETVYDLNTVNLRNALIMSEILGKPVSKRRRTGR